MHTLRTRFKKEIVAEFLPPTKKSAKVIIFCDGMPTVPYKRDLLSFLAKHGYWIFHPRYRGSWESGGQFLKISPHKDILDVISQLPRGFKDLWSNKTYKVRPKKIYLFGGSFGGPAAILASLDKRVDKVIVISPVVDWRAESKAEPIDLVNKYVMRAFGNGYRYSKRNWDKLKIGKFYNPAARIKEIDGRKLFIIHAKDDESVLWRPVLKFAKAVGAKIMLLKKGEHLSSMNFIKPRFYKKIKKFIDSK